jgi:hypothetical protein
MTDWNNRSEREASILRGQTQCLVGDIANFYHLQCQTADAQNGEI